MVVEEHCSSCGAEDEIVMLDDCGHKLCKNCILNLYLVAKQSKSVTNIRCPINDCPVSPNDLQCCLSEEEYEEFLDKCFQEYIELDQVHIINCPKEECRNKMEKMLRTEDEVKFLRSSDSEITQRGADNRLLSRTGWVHFNLHRIRCPECGDDFCSICLKSPYHLGLTCEQYEAYLSSRKCRFCDTTLNDQNCAPISSFNALLNCCTADECLKKREMACKETLSCGHFCGGIVNEKECLPCLEPECIEKLAENSLSVVPKMTKEDYCNICWVESIGEAPSVMLNCGHIFHHSCIKKKLDSRWNTPHISFGFAECPLCKVMIEHVEFESNLHLIKQLQEKVLSIGHQSLSPEDKQEIANPDSNYYQKPDEFILNKLSFYMCSSCRNPFFGGKLECNNLLNNEAQNVEQEEITCNNCRKKDVIIPCSNPEHTDFWTYKCRYCCSKAVWFCFGTHHFCDPCHNRAGTLRNKGPAELQQCAGPEACPLKIKHPPNGEEYLIGCEFCQERHELSPEETKRILAAEKRRKIFAEWIKKTYWVIYMIFVCYGVEIIYSFMNLSFLYGLMYTLVNLGIVFLFGSAYNYIQHYLYRRRIYPYSYRLTPFGYLVISAAVIVLIFDILREFIPVFDEFFLSIGVLSMFSTVWVGSLLGIFTLRVLILYSLIALIPLCILIKKKRFTVIATAIVLLLNAISYYNPISDFESVFFASIMVWRICYIYTIIAFLFYFVMQHLHTFSYPNMQTKFWIRIISFSSSIELLLYMVDSYSITSELVMFLMTQLLIVLRVASMISVPIFLLTKNQFNRQNNFIYQRRTFWLSIIAIITLLSTDVIFAYYSLSWTDLFSSLYQVWNNHIQL